MQPIRLLLASCSLLAFLFLATSPAHAQAPASPCAADLTDDGVVGAADLAEVLAGWGGCGKSCPADLDGSGAIDARDLAMVLTLWGTGCPKITGVSPVAGPPFGGTTVTITGTHLGGVTEVRIGDHLAHQVTVVDENTVTAVVPSSQPAGSTGPRAVTLVTDSGESSLANGYTYVLLGSGSPPSISMPSSSSPVTKPATGGETVTITGANLTGATAVMIAGISSGFTVVSDTLIAATAPAHAPGGMFDVAVTTPAGTYTAVGAIAYWQAPAWGPTVIQAAPDPAVVYDPALRTAILKTGRPWRVFYVGALMQIEMLLIPPTTFNMGCSDSDEFGCETDEHPVHAVTLTKPFYLGRYEVTQAQWTARMGSNPSNFQASNGYPNSANRPVESVSWNDIVDDFQPGTGLRLPTEAEWEWACRAGTTTAFHGWPAQPNGTNDDDLVHIIAWYGWNSDFQTQPVGLKEANGFGLYDMAGNVCEWCADGYKEDYYSHSPSIDPPGGNAGPFHNRVLRGGYWWNSTFAGRSSQRNGPTFASASQYGGGFRVARNAE